MTVAQLIDSLSRLAPETEVMILDGSNGGGTPRTINLGPVAHRLTDEDVDNAADCEELGEGAEVFVIGFGCY